MARSKALSADTIRSLQEEAAQLRAQGVSLRGWAAQMAKLLDVSMDTIYRSVKEEVSTRKRRSDRGSLKAMEAEVLADIAAFVVQHDYSAELAINTVNTLRAEQGLPEIEVHTETVLRHLRQLGVSRRDNAQDLRVHRRWEAPRPLYLVQMDSTVAASWYIDTDDTIGYESPVQLGKNKAGNGKPRIWMLTVVDDYSRVKWARYYAGNSAPVWLDMLTRVMRKGAFGEPDVWPAYGVPERLYTDQDAAMKARESVSFLAAFEIERMLANPSNPHFTNAQAKGKVERAQGHILHSFEKVTRAKRFESLEAMNRALNTFLVTINNAVHSTTGKAPFERWLEAAQIRVLPEAEIVRRVSARVDEAWVSPDLAIKLEGKTYQLPRRDPFLGLVKKSVVIRYYRADLSRITVIVDGQAHEIDAVEAVPDRAGEFHAAPAAPAVEVKKALLERDLGKYDGAVHRVFEHVAAKDPRTYPIRPKEVEHPLTATTFAAVMIRRGKAIERAQKEGVVSVPPSDTDRAAVDVLFSGRGEIPEPELTSWIQSRRETGTTTPQLRVHRA